ncbi:MAG TPA: DUF169 domain-containing protein [Methanomassiliicoccales archaeon]|nr:DUF169 domain-containing protein [Methanomassiliicoccales archaeon]
MNNAEMSKVFMESLGLQTEPVAITLIKKGMPLPAGYAVPDKPLRHCQAIMRARKGEMLAVPADKQACPVGASALGITPIPDKVKSGEFHYNLGMYENLEAAAKTISVRPHLEPMTNDATALAPLSKATLDPDVVVVVGVPEQVYWIIPAASTYSIGGRITVETASFQATCADSTIVPMNSGNVNISLGCFGCRKATDIKPEEMLVGIPRQRLAEVVRALQKLAQGPIPKSRQKG